jgi:hypothetical protein
MIPMKLRYEIKDRENPSSRGQRFTNLERAENELARSVPRSRWYLYDRLLKVAIAG